MLERGAEGATGEKLKAMLRFLDKLALQPEAVTPADLAPVRAAGVSDQAIEDAIAVCALFSIIVRVADALGFDLQTPEGYARGAQALLKRGYKL